MHFNFCQLTCYRLGLRMVCLSRYNFKSALVSAANLFMVFALAHSCSAGAANAVGAKQDLGLLKAKVQDFLQTQTLGYPGKALVSVGAIDPQLRLAQCPNPEIFLAPGSRAWGRTTVSVRCVGPSAWTIYVQANVSVIAQYLVAATPLAQGKAIATGDLLFETGDLTQLPVGIFTEPAQAVGRLVNVSMAAGTVLRQDLLKMPPAIQQGQSVTLVTIGKGFRVSAEGVALTKAAEGQVVQVRVSNGRVVTGIAKQGSIVEVGF